MDGGPPRVFYTWAKVLPHSIKKEPEIGNRMRISKDDQFEQTMSSGNEHEVTKIHFWLLSQGKKCVAGYCIDRTA